MNNEIRQRVAEAAAELQQHPHLQTYETIRVAWRKVDKAQPHPRNLLPTSRLNQLLSQPAMKLSIDELTELADHISIAGLSGRDALQVGDTAREFGAFALPRHERPGDWLYYEQAQDLAMRYSLWLGNVAAPAFGMVGQFRWAVRLARRFLSRLASEGFRHVLGAGYDGGDDDHDMRLLLFTPALSGLTTYWPRGRQYDRGAGTANSLVRQLVALQPLSECMLLRAAAFGAVVGAPAAGPLMAEAAVVAKRRSERSLAQAFELFAKQPNALTIKRESLLPAKITSLSR